ncbi:DNA polymerase III subunit delta' [Acetivibrio clariflavus]|uniref:DNA polymerase III subunit delta' n=1 Tax=Acetivibrio clariflavus TaxID=288965 RepID=UPI00030F60D9|nr:DNA polymerase III subunit delta' [Acetivibrio clariflavus]
MNFSDIVGQNEVVNSLKNILKEHSTRHAYIFAGPEGIGKRLVAKVFAAALLCSDCNSLEACEDCQPCRLFQSGTNPDFYVLETEGTSISVDDIRKMQQDISIRPMYSEKKVYLIAEADKMTAQAQNCLLKTLEEPPEYAVIILTAVNINSLLETIRSRCILYNFRKNTDEEIRQCIKKIKGSELAGIDFIVSYADGVPGKAIRLIESEDFLLIRDKVIEIMLKLRNSNLTEIFDAYGFFEENKDNIDSILDIMLMFYRDLLIAKKAGKENILINSDKKDIILKNADRYEINKLIKNVNAIEEARRNIKQNANYQLVIEVMLMKLQEE